VSIEQNKEIASRLHEKVVNQKNLSALDDYVATDVVWHNAPPGLAPGIEGYKQFFPMLYAGFPDYHATVEDIIAAGDKVVHRFTGRGTHKGEWMGIAPTGKQVTATGILIYRITGGKIVEEWLQYDVMGLMQQLGAVPTPGQGGR
jgi:predicted ester cyclase